MNKKYQAMIQLSVRDYEVDLQGIVNNAVYQNYLEHARHEILRNSGINFAGLHEEGIDPILIHADIHYHYSLKSNDPFVIATNMVLDGKARIVFIQDIFRLPDFKVILNARMSALVVKNGRPVRLPLDIMALVDLPEKYRLSELK